MLSYFAAPDRVRRGYLHIAVALISKAPFMGSGGNRDFQCRLRQGQNNGLRSSLVAFCRGEVLPDMAFNLTFRTSPSGFGSNYCGALEHEGAWRHVEQAEDLALQ